jgi:hypothetical protein
MSDFVFLFRASDAESRENMGTPERAQETMQVWLAWIRDLEAKGHLKSRGEPLDRVGKVVKNKTITDGPYVEGKDMVLGFLIIQARDLEQATELAKGCPMVQGGGSVEVRPVSAMTF